MSASVDLPYETKLPLIVSRKLAPTDTIGFCVSKGLSAPVGSVLCGTRAFIERARTFRRMVGGNMRQAGPLAAAGIVALENMVARLPEDHQMAKRLATGLNKIDASIVDPASVETNLVRVTVRASGRKAAEWSEALKKRSVRVSPCATVNSGTVSICPAKENFTRIKSTGAARYFRFVPASVPLHITSPLATNITTPGSSKSTSLHRSRSGANTCTCACHQPPGCNVPKR